MGNPKAARKLAQKGEIYGIQQYNFYRSQPVHRACHRLHNSQADLHEQCIEATRRSRQHSQRRE